MKTRWTSTVFAGLAFGVATLALQNAPAQQAKPAGSAPIDAQQVRDQDDMTWKDYRPIPGTDWANPERKGADKTLRIAILTADFEDQPFVMTLPLRSDLFGNPQIPPVKREEIARFYADFWNKPQAINGGHTVHEYWMELSRGRVGITMQPFGPYRMSKKSFQYGLRQNDMPEGFTADGNMSRELDTMWKADAGEEIGKQFDVVLRIYAGYDETCIWQEFGEMKFLSRDAIPPEWGNPDPNKPRWARTRYTDWTSWKAASYLWSNSAIVTGESSGSIRHEISHFAFKIGDNNNNPYVQPYRRAGAGPWDVMDRGSFNGPGGPHRRFLIPVMEGGAAPAGLMLRQMINFGFLKKEEVLELSRQKLAESGVIVADVAARETAPGPNAFAGIVVRLDGAEPVDRTPVEDPATHPLSAGVPNYTFYTMEVVQRIGYDSFTPDSGVLLAKNKDKASSNGGPNGFSVFNWVIDAHPEDIGKVDFKRPDGTPVMRTVADYRQLNDALFHAGMNSGSQYEWEDTPNRLHFYVVNLRQDAKGIRTYTLAVRSLDGAGSQARGVAVTAPAQARAARDGSKIEFTLKNTGAAGQAIAADSDVYRLEVSVDGEGWSASLPNALAAVKAGQSGKVVVWAKAGAARSAKVKLVAVSESDPTKKAEAVAMVRQ